MNSGTFLKVRAGKFAPKSLRRKVCAEIFAAASFAPEAFKGHRQTHINHDINQVIKPFPVRSGSIADLDISSNPPGKQLRLGTMRSLRLALLLLLLGLSHLSQAFNIQVSQRGLPSRTKAGDQRQS